MDVFFNQNILDILEALHLQSWILDYTFLEAFLCI